MQPWLKDVTDLARLRKLLDKTYRDGYLEARVRGGISYQMKALRRKFGLSQIEMAKKLGLKQSVVSRLESVDRGNVTVSTLLNVAKKLDVALVVQFVDYPSFLDATRDMSEKALQPDTIQESVQRATQRPEAFSVPTQLRVRDRDLLKNISLLHGALHGSKIENEPMTLESRRILNPVLGNLPYTAPQVKERSFAGLTK